MNNSLLATAEARRAKIIRDVPRGTRALNGQFLTPEPVARFMAEMFSSPTGSPIRLLDPGAGAGALTFAFIDRLLNQDYQGPRAELVAVEADASLASDLTYTVTHVLDTSPEIASKVSVSVIQQDFIAYGVSKLMPLLRDNNGLSAPFTHAILNPPYSKLSP